MTLVLKKGKLEDNISNLRFHLDKWKNLHERVNSSEKWSVPAFYHGKISKRD